MNRNLKRIGKWIGERWPWPVLATLKNGRRIYVDLRSKVGQGIYVKGEFDPAVFQAIAPALHEGGRFLDLGAHSGYYSMLALDAVGPTGRIDAFEIDERSLRCLRKTKSRYGLDAFHIHPIAVGGQIGTTNLIKESECGNSYCGDGNEGICVPMTTLDAWAIENSVTDIAAIKIDVEGFELPVLRGAESVLDQFRPTVVIEAEESLQSRNGASVADIESTFQRLGYSTRSVDGCWTPTLIATPIQG